LHNKVVIHWATGARSMHFYQIAESCLLTCTCCFSFSHDALWFNQRYSFQQESDQLTFMLQNYDANLLLTHGLHRQQS